MGLFGASSSKKNENTVTVPQEILARISVLGDHVADTQPKTEVLTEQVVVPTAANPVPHGPAEAFTQRPVGSSGLHQENKEPSFAVSPEVAGSSPFLQDLSPEELVVPKKEKAGVEPPLFFSQNSQQNSFGFGQTRPNVFPAGFSPAVGAQNIAFSDEPTSTVSSHKAIWIFGLVFVLLVSGLSSAYYFLYVYSDTKMTSSTQDTQLTDMQNVVEDDAHSQTLAEFSLESANYLSLNVETVSLAQVQEQIRNISERMRTAGITTPVEFTVTDQTNTPIAFSRFVMLTGMKFPEEIVSVADEEFSLFIKIDQGKTRVGLRVLLKQADTTPLVFRKAEGDFLFALQNMYFEAKVSPVKKAIFKQGVYHDIPVRYSNVPGVENLSVDYTVVGNEWYIGTSKDTVRGMLDYEKK